MSATNETLHGWSPTSDGDEEVNISQDIRFMTINSFPSSAFLSPICPPLDSSPVKTCPPLPHSTPLPKLTGVSHTPPASSSDRRAQRNRNRDPSWIPRPRNAFIIFRCEYSREHSQGSQDLQNDHNTNDPSAKTLSKRAADAWKQLSPSERDRYKVLADVEREEHARLYPHYRFRPMKRQPSGTRKTSCECSKGPAAVSVERPPPSSTHVPSVLTSAPPKSRPEQSIERPEASTTVPQATTASLPEPSSHQTDTLADLQLPFAADYDPLLLYSSPETTIFSDPSPPSSVDLCAPLPTSMDGIAPNAPSCDDSMFNLDFKYNSLEEAQALEAYAIGLYNCDLLSPFTFPEY